MIKIVVMVITVWNTSTGDLLKEVRQDWDRFNITGNPIEECRRYGVQQAYKMTEWFKKLGYDYASTNVDCHWEERPGQGA